MRKPKFGKPPTVVGAISPMTRHLPSTKVPKSVPPQTPQHPKPKFNKPAGKTKR